VDNMNTKFKLIFEGDSQNIDLDRFRQSLVASFEVKNEENGIYVIINSSQDEDDSCQYLIDRELDRHFFLTSVKIKAEMVRKVVTSSFSFYYRTHGSLPETISSQIWNYELSTQLRLWALAVDANDIYLKIILLFQIIELSHPDCSDYPKYTDTSNQPSPLTEAKFLRHLVVHSGDVDGSQLKKYCTYLGLPELMFDPTDTTHNTILAEKVGILEKEAKLVIERCLFL